MSQVAKWPDPSESLYWLVFPLETSLNHYSVVVAEVILWFIGLVSLHEWDGLAMFMVNGSLDRWLEKVQATREGGFMANFFLQPSAKRDRPSLSLRSY